MKIELAGATVCVVGRIKGWSKNSIKRTLEATGGELIGMPKEGCLVLVGSNPSWYTLDRARARVCTILEGDDALALLADGAFELTEEPPRAFGELIAQARALFDQRPTLESFAELTAFLDTCPPGHADDLADYIAPQLADWGPMMLSHDYSLRHPDRFAWRYTGLCGDAGGSMRAMPNRWIVELMNDGPSPKHRICDTLSFTDIEASSKLAAGIFDHGPLTHLRAFSPGRSSPRFRMTVPFYKRMVKSDALEHVETFTLTECAESAFDVLMKRPEFLPNLKTIHIDHTTWRLTDAAAFAGLWGEQLETLKVSRPEHIRWLRDHRRRFPVLSRLIIELPNHRENHVDTLPAVVEGADTLTLATREVDDILPVIDVLAASPPESLRTLDLSCINSPRTCSVDPASRLGERLARSRLCRSIDRVILNTDFDDELRKWLDDRGAEVEIRPLQ